MQNQIENEAWHDFQIDEKLYMNKNEIRMYSMVCTGPDTYFAVGPYFTTHESPLNSLCPFIKKVYRTSQKPNPWELFSGI